MSANSNNRSKKLLKTIFKANSGCGCGKPKPTDVFEPKPKPSQTLEKYRNSSSTSNDGVSITTTATSGGDFWSSSTAGESPVGPAAERKKMKSRCVAVVKESDDPLRDFKQSMKQMIVEKEIYEKPDLEELLACFLELNSASHRHVIVRAFAEIWSDVVSERLVGGGGGEEVMDTCQGDERALDSHVRGKSSQ